MRTRTTLLEHSLLAGRTGQVYFAFCPWFLMLPLSSPAILRHASLSGQQVAPKVQRTHGIELRLRSVAGSRERHASSQWQGSAYLVHVLSCLTRTSTSSPAGGTRRNTPLQILLMVRGVGQGRQNPLVSRPRKGRRPHGRCPVQPRRAAPSPSPRRRLGERVLVTSHTNAAADVAFDRIVKWLAPDARERGAA